MSSPVVITTVVPSEELAREISRLLVVKKLAACVQVYGPVSSFYTWKDRLTEDVEWMCIIKAHQDNYLDIESCIVSLHPYEVPEIILTGVLGGHKPYLDWILANTI